MVCAAVCIPVHMHFMLTLGFFAVLRYFSEWLLNLFIPEPELSRLAGDYLRVLILGL